MCRTTAAEAVQPYQTAIAAHLCRPVPQACELICWQLRRPQLAQAHQLGPHTAFVRAALLRHSTQQICGQIPCLAMITASHYQSIGKKPLQTAAP